MIGWNATRKDGDVKQDSEGSRLWKRIVFKSPYLEFSVKLKV